MTEYQLLTPSGSPPSRICGRKWFLVLLLLAAGIYSAYIVYFDAESNPIPLLRGKVGEQAADVIYGKRTKDDHSLNECHLKEFPDGWTDAAVSIVTVDKDPLRSCDHSFKPMTELINGTVALVNASSNSTGSIDCRVRDVFITSDRSWDASKWHDMAENYSFTRDVVHVQCTEKKRNYTANFYEFIHTQTYRNRSADVEAERSKVKEREEKKSMRPNVHIFVVDSVGNTAGIRSLAHTTAYLRDAFSAVNFRHVNKVGQNSRPNGAAFLLNTQLDDFDRSLLGLPNVPADYTSGYFCSHPITQDKKFILREFEKQRGYVSLWSEDWANGLFNWPNCVGFDKQPITHYMKPFYQLYESKEGKTVVFNQSESHCYETYHFQLDYLQQFIKTYSDVPKTSLTWMVELGHNSNEKVFHSDKVFHEFFERNREEFDNSFIFFMSDHGMRWGSIVKSDIGSIEVNSVMMFVSVPKWMRSNLKLFETTRRNAGKLLTQFDIHATLLDLIETMPKSNFTDFAALPPSNSSRGTSIFRPLPKTPRNCFTLPIPFEYCMCHLDLVEVKDSFVNEQAGQAVAKRINSILAAHNLTSLCSELSYDKVTEAKVVANTDGLFRFSVKLKPGGGEFDAWLRDVGQRGQPFFVPGSAAFSRTNSYDKDADCVAATGQEDMRPYCYCKKRS